MGQRSHYVQGSALNYPREFFLGHPSSIVRERQRKEVGNVTAAIFIPTITAAAGVTLSASRKARLVG
jgi:hypothetical protein